MKSLPGELAYVFRILDSEDLFAQVLQVVKRRLRSDGVDEGEALAVLHVQVSHCRKLLLLQKIKKVLSTVIVHITGTFPRL